MDTRPTESEVQSEPRLGWRAVAVAAAFYVLCVSIATWPRILMFRSTLPSLFDPLQHLWVMRWYRSCLLEGRSLILCPEVQYPTGVPLGCFSPLHFQALLYIPLSFVIPNDVLCYNMLWLFGFVSTGLGTFLLTWRVVRDRYCAGFGGMLAMLSAPMLWHGSAHLELIYLGAFPLFLWSWLRLFDEPSRARLLAAAGAYVLVALCAAYFAVYAVFPAALYFFWKGSTAGRSGAWTWFRNRARWLAAFAALVVPCLVLVFSNHIWALANGYSQPRSIVDFRAFGAPLWSYACPSWMHFLGREFPSTWYTATGYAPKIGECCSYLGVVAVALIAYAAAFHVPFRGASYWWLCLVLLVVLSGGTAWTIVGYEIPLPGEWLRKHFPLFQMIRCPSRFNLYAAVVAALVAANGLKHLLAHVPWTWMRGIVLASLTAGAVADLAMVPYFQNTIPQMPGCYNFMQRTAPGAAFVEVPQFGSGGSDLYSIAAYWQSHHRGRTTAGYCGQSNAIFDNLVTRSSPFRADQLARPDYLEDPERTPLELGGAASFADYAWLYLTAHGFRFVVVHRESTLVAPSPQLDRLKSLLAPAQVYADEGSIVYDRERMPLPANPVLITTWGWRKAVGRRPLCVADRQAHILLYNPASDRELQLTIDARSLHETRRVRLVSAGKELARWEVQPAPFQMLARHPFRLASGLHDLMLESDGTSRPRSKREAAAESDMGPYSLKVGRLELDASAAIARR
jgi:hypothetical protein